jgi:hypothetical protein
VITERLVLKPTLPSLRSNAKFEAIRQFGETIPHRMHSKMTTQEINHQKIIINLFLDELYSCVVCYPPSACLPHFDKNILQFS